jgi:hypothetical protein
MKMSTLLTVLSMALLAAWCGLFHSQPKTARTAASVPAAPPAIVTPDNSLTARVLSYSASGRFVVLGFPVGQMPKPNQSFFLYREGMKVGEVKIDSSQQRDNLIVADLVAGEAQVGDEVRDQ